jgi:hypothetical protein
MKGIIKILGVIAIVALLLGGVVVPVAATPGVTVSIDAPDEVAPDSDFTANVNISEVVNFDACNYNISFDASVLRLDNVTSGLIGSTPIPVDVYNQISPGEYRIVQNVSGLAGVSGSGYLAILHFHVIGSGGDSSISLSDGVLSDSVASEIEVTWAGGSVRVAVESPKTITLPTAVNPSPEPTAPPAAVNSIPEETAPSEAAPSPAEPIDWSVLWKAIGGVVVVGFIILLLARRRAY